ncbi:MAG: type II toxin-antitoxin system HicA family toxin [Candidatus Aenigmarchaeota archaeon]|nr:type II toxin-antitoxin system HicA family toxin [Candidatus Aenigmarchaeota archaeon]
MQGKLHPLPRKQIIQILQSNGFQQVKVVKGRHLKFRKQTDTEVLTTMVSHRPEIQPTIIRHIIKQSKKPEDEFY